MVTLILALLAPFAIVAMIEATDIDKTEPGGDEIDKPDGNGPDVTTAKDGTIEPGSGGNRSRIVDVLLTTIAATWRAGATALTPLRRAVDTVTTSLWPYVLTSTPAARPAYA